MKYFYLLFILLPTILISQNVGIGTTQPTEKLEVNGIIFTSQGGIKFPDGTIQTTAYSPPPGMMQTGLSGLVIEFATGPGINIVGPAQDAKITNGLNVQSFSEGSGQAVQLINGNFDINGPNLSEITVSRSSDYNTTALKDLLFKGTLIPYIEIFSLRIYGEAGQYYIDHWTRYENCILTSFSSSGTDFLSESFSFAFKKACYRSYKRNPSDGTELSNNDGCYDIVGENPNCTCVWP